MLVPHGTLILAVDGSHMQLLRNRGRDHAPDLETLRHNYAIRQPSHLMEADAPGRSFESVGTARHAYPTQDLHQRQIDAFALDALRALEQLLGADDRAVVIAPPRILGLLRSQFSHTLRACLIAELDKDVAQFKPGEIASYLHGFGKYN